MAIGSPVVSTVTANSSAQTIAITPPATINDGDLLIAVSYFEDNQTHTMSTGGWTKVLQQDVIAAGDSSVAFYKPCVILL